MENALEIRNLTKHYAGFTLDGLNLTLPAGCIMGFIGENGAGKSTTIKLILDLVRRDAGDVRVLGHQDVGENRRLKEQLGVVMDECGFTENLTLRDIGRIMKNCYRTWDQAQFDAYAKRFDLPGGKRIKEYSRGMKMKLSIAVALSHGSKLLILDEATSGLDPIVREEILDVFLDFIQDENHSILISSHIISDLEKICDYIALIHQGRLLFCEPKDELLDRYAMVKCGEKEYAALDPSRVIGARHSGFGVEALLPRGSVPAGMAADPATLEEIMLYFVKEGNQ